MHCGGIRSRLDQNGANKLEINCYLSFVTAEAYLGIKKLNKNIYLFFKLLVSSFLKEKVGAGWGGGDRGRGRGRESHAGFLLNVQPTARLDPRILTS